MAASTSDLRAQLSSFLPHYELLTFFAGPQDREWMRGLLLLYVLWNIAQYTWRSAHFFRFKSTIEFSDRDAVFTYFMEWLKDDRSIAHNNMLQATTSYGNIEKEVAKSDDGFLNFQRSLTEQVDFTPSSIHWFWHNGCLFKLTRETRTLSGGGDGFRQTWITIACYGRSAESVKALLEECKRTYWGKREKNTNIFKPRGRSGNKDWRPTSGRCKRPIDTIALDPVEKDILLKDINEYLDPTTAEWYIRRGVPYRRGYLFHGPPGTGKSSTSFAIAGLFGLPLYCLSLVDCTQDDLDTLMADLPSRCILLLEDVDAAGLVRRPVNGRLGPSKAPESGSPGNDSSDGAQEELNERKNLSLSGLLNAIDGVASREGLVLILTTNRPHELDDALTRPGRVDMKVLFPLAERPQIKDLFARMYAEHEEAMDGELASRFCEQFENGVWSTAEIQGYLLQWKHKPKGAVEHASEWIEKEKEQSLQATKTSQA